MKIKTLLILITFSLSVSSQNWELVGTGNNKEDFRTYYTLNGLAGIMDEENSKLITFHSSASTGTIVRCLTDLNNPTTPIFNEIAKINPCVANIRGAGFYINKYNDKWYLYGTGIGTDAEKDKPLIFAKEITPQFEMVEYNQEGIISATVNAPGYTGIRNGVADKLGNYFVFAYNSNNGKTHFIRENLFINEEEVIQYNIDGKVVGAKIKEYNDITYIVAIVQTELTDRLLIYKIANSNSTLIIKSFKDIIGVDPNYNKVRNELAFDIDRFYGEDVIYFMNWFGSDASNCKLYSLNINNLEATFIHHPSSSLSARVLNIDKDHRVHLSNLSYHEVFNPISNNWDITGNSMTGEYLEKIVTINDPISEYFLSRSRPTGIDDFDDIMLYKSTGEDILSYIIPFKEKIENAQLQHTGGMELLSMVKDGNSVLYFDRAYAMRNNLQDNSFESLKIKTSATSAISIGNNELILGSYYGPILQKLKYGLNKNLEVENFDLSQLITGSTKSGARPVSLAKSGNFVYIGTRRASLDDITKAGSLFRYDKNLPVKNQNSYYTYGIYKVDGKEVHGIEDLISVNYSNKDYIFGCTSFPPSIFQLDVTGNQIEDIPIKVNAGNITKVFGLSLIELPNGVKWLYAITHGENHLIRYNITDPDNIVYDTIIKTYDLEIEHIKSLDNKFLLVTLADYSVNMVNHNNGHLTFLGNTPYSIQNYKNTFQVDDEFNEIFVATKGGVENCNNNSGGKVYRKAIPFLLDFCCQTRYEWNTTPEFIYSGKFDGDITDDIGIYIGGNWHTRLNIGNGQFAYNKKTDWNCSPDFIISGDFNGDGFDDICVNKHNDPASIANGEWIIRYNDGNRNFPEDSQTRYKWNCHPDNIFCGDFNKDGKDDIGVYIHGNWHTRLNIGNGQFAYDNKTEWDCSPDFIVSGDFNGDGYDDICVNKHSDPVSLDEGEWIIRYNDGNRAFSEDSQTRYKWGSDVSPQFILSGDYNKDNIDDIAVLIDQEWIIRYNLNETHINTLKSTSKLNMVESQPNRDLLDQPFTFRCYPNPTTDVIYVATKRNYGSIEIILYSLQGEAVKKIVFDLEKVSDFQIDIKGLSAGTYLLTINDTKTKINLATEKVMKL